MATVEVKYIGSNGEYQDYVPSDKALINASLITPTFGVSENDYIEYFIKDLGGIVLSANYYNTQYKLGAVDPVTGTTTALFLNPERDAANEGYDRGIVNVKYNFFRRQLLSRPNREQNFWIKEISTTRREIKVARQDLSNTQLLNAFTSFNTQLAADAYYPDFLLNFGADLLVIGINAAYVEEGGSGYIVFKLYEPLPIDIDLKATFWVVTQVAEPAQFNVSVTVDPERVLDTLPIKGPNYKVKLDQSISQTTPYYSIASLLTTSVSSSFQKFKSLMDEKAIQINVDYSNFENFIHFSSATERLHNFVYKLQEIESSSAALQAPNTPAAKIQLQNGIDNIITKFDPYEYYLYFSSASAAWPKSTSIQPYSLYSVTSSISTNWLGSPNTYPTTTTMSMFYSSSYYDNQNKDLLQYATPSYIRDDQNNQPYLVFLDMIGQHFDNIWIYLKDVSNRYSAENNPFVGISMDQVSEALQSFGLQLYTNTSISDNLYYTMFGINDTGSTFPVTSSNYASVNIPSSSLYPLPGNSYLSSSIHLPPFGEEKINRYVTTFVTASAGVTSSFATLPAGQLTDEIYKRLYHNLAFLLKTRGTERGVRALITTFGIPEEILNVHEFGGYNIYSVAGIQEIANNKITTGSVLQISSSLLSPNVTLQLYQNNTNKSSIDLEIGFSPADSINASITSSGYVTSSTQPGYFNIMQYIGAPSLQYSSSYIPLDKLSNTYFNAEYTSGYNVWDFIRVIKYFNNSLFKMARDFVPARASANTGIIIKSHILERNKYARHEPTATTSSYDALLIPVEISGSDGGAVIGDTYYVEAIPIQYQSNSIYLRNAPGIVYMSSSNNIQKYNGEFSGSTIIGATNYFSQEEVSSYAFSTTSSVAPSQHGGQNIMFLTYSVSPISENVFEPVRSQRFYDLDYNTTQNAPVNFGLITKSIAESSIIGPISQSRQPYSQYAYIQDYNYYFRPTVAARYDGVKLIGLAYNTYSVGDTSYGNEPVINYYSNKVGFFTQVQTSSFIPGKVNATLAYLAEVSGGLFELDQNNKNWEDVQNIFKAGTNLTIKQFDNRKYSNQKTTDGVKVIYNSGYSYTPQLYFLSGSDKKLYFQYVGESVGGTFSAFNNLGTGLISGSGVPSYPVTLENSALRSGPIYRIFDTANPTTDYTASTSTSFPTYSISEAGQKQFTFNFGVNFEFPNPSTNPIASGSYSFGVYQKTPSNPLDVLIGDLQTVNFTSSYTPGSTITGSIDKNSVNASPDTGLNPTNLVYAYATVSGPFTLTTDGLSPIVIGDATSTIDAGVYNYTQGGSPIQKILVTSTSVDIAGSFNLYNSLNPTILNTLPQGGGGTIPAVTISSATRTFNYTTLPTNFSQGDLVVFKFRQEGMSTSNYTSSVSIGTANSSLAPGTIAVGLGGYPFATSSAGLYGFIDNMVDNSPLGSSITLNSSLSAYYQYQFVPAFESASVLYTSSLYAAYGDSNYPFYPEPGDKIILRDFSGISQDLNVLTSSFDAQNRVVIDVVPQILDNWVLNPKLIARFLLLKRYKDEQNVILTFNKNPGVTSYGFAIPNTINPLVLANINTLQAAVQSQLLSNQSLPSIDTISGGTFGP